jgi:cation:H+ antiporter
MTYVLFLAGFVLLLKGADLLIEGGGSLALRLGVSELAVGLTVISMGTSLPELVVSLLASMQGNADLAIGNVLGSNIANVLLILGVCAIIRELPIRDSTLLSEIPFSLAAALLVGFLANAALFSPLRELSISRMDGAILLSFFVLFLLYIFRIARVGLAAPVVEGSTAVHVLELVIGSAGLALGGKWVVDGALGVSEQLGVSESFVGLTIVAIGTSVPELTTSAIAAYRGKGDIAVGNVVGSNIFNLLWVLGVSAVISPLPFDVVSNTDIAMIILASTLFMFGVVIGRPNAIARWEGWIFLLTYAGYFTFLIVRQ